MQLTTRKLLDRSFTGTGLFAIALMAAALVFLLGPIFVRGAGAVLFRATVEHRRLLFERFGRGSEPSLRVELARVEQARRPVYERLAAFEKEMQSAPRERRMKYREPFKELKAAVATLLGPAPGEPKPVLPRDQYGQTRWDRAQVKAHELLYTESYEFANASQMGVKKFTPRLKQFEGTSLEPLFPYIEKRTREMLLPRPTLYWGFLTDEPLDANMFGGIWPALLGTFYLTLGAMLLAAPLGIGAAIYFVEYGGQGRLITLLRACVNTLAGVPSIVFGLFGLAFLINTLQVSKSKSVLAGAMTLALLVLPSVIRTAEEAIRAVPGAYRQASLALGASQWRTIFTVILPASLPGILTGVIIGMGRAAGETAPIIFTAAVSFGAALKPWEAFAQPTPALPWNIYNLCTEHAAVDEIRHVQYGMVLALVLLVLLMNTTAIWLRARISRRLRG
ncbi:MAG: phosphate ABC transporter permease PstA [Candidatus Sumerlaeota bacterium]|nr:phosphate ABC transporter permease PstA [Candidatus Sumerlaeota bacterium]